MFFIIITLLDSGLKHYHKELKWNIASPDHLLKISVTLCVGRYRHVNNFCYRFVLCTLEVLYRILRIFSIIMVTATELTTSNFRLYSSLKLDSHDGSLG